jgi:hypothetical protein
MQRFAMKPNNAHGSANFQMVRHLSRRLAVAPALVVVRRFQMSLAEELLDGADMSS